MGRIHGWSAVFCVATLLVWFVNVVSPVHVLAVASISQVGADIDGEAAGDNSGRSVAMSGDGSRIAIGAPTTTAPMATAVIPGMCASTR